MAEVKVPRAQLLAIVAAGAAAAEAGEPMVCPYPLGGSAEDRVRGAAWVRGYLRVAKGIRRD